MSNHDPLTLKLSLREKCAYGVGDFGSNLMLCIGTLYLLKFYTDEDLPKLRSLTIVIGRHNTPAIADFLATLSLYQCE